MKIQETVAKSIAKVSKLMAKKACGAASNYGWYQTKEPTQAIEKLKK